MPLKKIPRKASKTLERKIIAQNIAMLQREGRSPEQAQAIAFSNAKRDKKRYKAKK